MRAGGLFSGLTSGGSPKTRRVPRGPEFAEMIQGFVVWLNCCSASRDRE